MPVYSEDIDVPGLYRHGAVVQRSDGALLTTLPERVSYEERNDTRIHVVADGERLMDIAVLYYFESFGDDALDMWEVIANFQPIPLLDGSVALPANAEILIPSEEFIRDVAFGPSLADAAEI